MPKRPPPQLREVLSEIIRRTGSTDDALACGHVVRLHIPPTPHERMQLLAARLLKVPIVVMPDKCRTVEEWFEQYGHLRDPPKRLDT